MPNQTVTLTSANTPGQSAPVAMNWRGGGAASAWIVPASSTSLGPYTVQYSIDDPQLVGGASVALWANLSSAIGQAGQSFNSSQTWPDGVMLQLPTIGSIRLNSSSQTNGGLSLRVMQGE